MNTKQLFKVFLVIYLIIMIITFIFLVISYSEKEWRLPPSNCPDFWVRKEDGTCYNIHKMKYGSNPLITSQMFDISNCDNINAIRNQQIIWDGITYGVGANDPC
jgi:hypothetical protein